MADRAARRPPWPIASVMNRLCLITPVLCLFLAAAAAPAATVAVLPLLDVTVSRNGVNHTLTGFVRREVEQRGFTLVPAGRIMEFLVRHRIRTLGRLDSHLVEAAGRELQADLLLQGTVCQLQEGAAPAISLSLELIRTADAATVWANTDALSASDLTSLLGLEDPGNLGDLYGVFFPRLLATMPTRVLPAAGEHAVLDIDSVILLPRHARPGDEISCRVRIRGMEGRIGNLPRLTAWVGDRGHPLELDREGYYLAARWPAADEPGEYTVSLAGRWPSGRTERAVIGSYVVDDHAPDLQLHLVGRELDGRLFFSDRLLIIPTLTDPEPVSRWEVLVIDRDDEVIVRQGAAQELPRRLTWRGQTTLGTLAPDGEYTVVFRVWDRTGLSSSAAQDVSFRRTPPDVAIDLERKEKAVTVKLDRNSGMPLAYWWMKVFAPDGRLLRLAEGVHLPADFTVELPEGAKETPLAALLVAADVLGNRTREKIGDLRSAAAGGEEGEMTLEKEWLEEF